MEPISLRKRYSNRRFLTAIITTYLLFSAVSSSGFLPKQRILGANKSSPNINGRIVTAHGGQFHEPGTPEFYTALGIALFLVCMAGVCSGLNVGLLSIDQVALKIKLKNGTDKEKNGAQKILGILENHHLLLSTLLVANALAMEALPIYLHEIVPAWLAVVISILIVVLFGEILPQAICTGPNQFQIASMSIPVIKLLELVFLPVCYPIAKCLDCLLGKHEGNRFQKNKKDLKAFIEQHSQQPSNHLQHFGFNQQEIQMLTSTMDLREQKVGGKMVKLDDVFMLGTHEIFSKELIMKIKQSGYSTVPIYDKDRQNIIGCLRTKIALKCEKKHLNKPIAKRFPLAAPLMIARDTNMLQMIQIFQLKKCSLAFITEEEKGKDTQDKTLLSNRDMIVDEFERIEGVIFLKDLFEEIVDIDFQDDDLHIEVNKKQKAAAVGGATPSHSASNQLKEPLISSNHHQ